MDVNHSINLNSERRQFPRVHLSAKSILSNIDFDYKGQLENISLSGALVRFEKCAPLDLGGKYILTINIEGEKAPLQLFVEVACTTFSLVGVKFVSCDTERTNRLSQLVQQMSTLSYKARVDLENIRRRFIDHFHEE